LLNLVINARDAMPQGGTLTIVARNAGELLPLELDGEFVVIAVSDTGSGIPPEHLPQVFEPFFTTKCVGQGTGLGMSQVYGMCKSSGGVATVHSELRVGTTVSLFFPASQGRDTALGDGPSPAMSLERSVLLVEDNADLVASLTPSLEMLGFRVRYFASATEALAWLDSTNDLPDAVLTDVVMPGDMDGATLARAIRTKWPELKLVLMSGYATDRDELAAEGYTVLTKPCSPDELAGALSVRGRTSRPRSGSVQKGAQ
jgi:CheY-like chemotaxis protein